MSAAPGKRRMLNVVAPSALPKVSSYGGEPLDWLKPAVKTYPQSEPDVRARVRSAARYPDQPGVDYRRPTHYRQCLKAGLGVQTPCPFVSCKHHLYLDVSPTNGSLKVNFPNRGPLDLPETCALAVANRGGLPAEDVAPLLGLERSRVRQLEDSARAVLGDNGEMEDLYEDIT